jgi:hypothetical protein
LETPVDDGTLLDRAPAGLSGNDTVEALDEAFAEFDFGDMTFDDDDSPATGTSEPRVAHLDNLAHTKGDEVLDVSSVGGFSFDDVTPRWLRKPEDSGEPISFSAQQELDAGEKLDWLRDAFEDDETD